MLSKTILNFSITFFFIVNSLLAQKGNAIELRIRTERNEIKNYRDLTMYFLFSKHDTLNDIILNKNFVYASSESCVENKWKDIIFEVERRSLKNYQSLNPVDDCFSTSRILNRNAEVQFDTIVFNEEFKINFNLSDPYQFTKGKYRVRVKYKYNKKSTKRKVVSIYSNWVYFQIMKSSIDISDLFKKDN
jgi:GH15 family glucan-1,4-alpha-glucosidase